ncbi:MAG: hypothetical protein QRY74_04890 [Chlamydia sp.]
MAIPTFFDFFRSYYEVEKTLPSVDLSDKALSPYSLADKLLSEKVQSLLVKNPDVQKIFSQPLYCSLEAAKNGAQSLEKMGFSLSQNIPKSKIEQLSTGLPIPRYDVIAHQRIPEYTFTPPTSLAESAKIQAQIFGQNGEICKPGEKESLLRFSMRERIQTIATKNGIEVLLPEENFIHNWVASKEMAVFDREATISRIKSMEPRLREKTIKEIATLVTEIGLAHASFETIRLTANDTIALIDTRPHGLIVEKKGFFSTNRGTSVEKCARVGLTTLIEETKALDICDLLKKEREKVNKKKISRWKIALSVVTVGLIPLVQLICSVMRYTVARSVSGILKKENKRLSDHYASFEIQAENRSKKMPLFYKDALTVELKKRIVSLQKILYLKTQGVRKAV